MNPTLIAGDTGAARLTHAVRAATAANRPAIAAFLTGGFPDPDRFIPLLERVAEESDIVEIGIPFSDPMADGVTIQRSSRVALERGVTLRWILACLARRHERSTPVVLMSYLNPLLAYGIEPLAQEAGRAGVGGMIIPDLPYEECRPIQGVLDDHGLALIQLVTPVTPIRRRKLLCNASRGFVYAVSMTGTTGGRAANDQAMFSYLDHVRDISPLPVLAGFGIREPEQVRMIGEHADGVIVGSALVEVVERGEDPAPFLRMLRGGAAERTNTS